MLSSTACSSDEETEKSEVLDYESTYKKCLREE